LCVAPLLRYTGTHRLATRVIAVTVVRITAIVGVAMVGLMAVGCGNSSATKPSTASPRRPSTSTTISPATATSITPTTQPTSASSMPVVALATCQPSQLSVSVSDQMGAVGTGHQIISLANSGPSPCTLYGFPGLGLLNSAGQSVPLQVTRATAAGMSFPAIPKLTITLTAGGGAAAFGMEWSNGPSTGTYSLQVTPPNDTGYLVVPDQVDVFANSQVSVTPVTSPGQLQ
jgi:hypothetical protein